MKSKFFNDDEEEEDEDEVSEFFYVFLFSSFSGQRYKTFSGRNLRIFVISQSVCPWQAFPA
jgi:hypothetical protein